FYNTPKYENTNNPYSEKDFEASPLNRVLKQAAPGYDWRMGGGHEIEMDYQSNTNTEVKRYEVSLTFANNTYTPQLVLSGSYNQGELYKSVTKDENHSGSTKNHTTEEFKDAEGRVLLKRTYADMPSAPQERHDTYYVYDIYGNLSYVLPPSAEPNSALPNSAKLNELCYQYTYDHRNRLVEKKIPGKDKEYIVYNRLDQPVLTQDAHLRSQNRWLFTKYDAFGRVAYTGVMTSSSTRTTLQNTLNSLSNMSVNKQGSATTIAGTSIYYNNGAYPTNDIVELHTINYYDNYTFDKAGGNSETSYGVTPITNAKGLATGSKVRVLTTTSPAQWITNVTYYDIKGRPIYNYSHNPYLETTDKVKSELGFDGRVTRVTTTHQKGTSPAITTEEIYEYDHQNRLLTHKQSINGATNPEVIVSNQYDELGQLERKGVGGKNSQSRLQTVDYSYNIRGWLKQINNPGNLGNDLFAFKIGYNEGTNPLYNGNISLTQWRSANTDNSLKTYNYTYDALNRIKTAIDNLDRYSLSNVSYDKNGNILSLTRKGHIVANPVSTNSAHFDTMDNLTYTYQANSNKLLKVSDAIVTPSAVQGEFKDDHNQTTPDPTNDYTYDANGNMKTDTNKGITNINYNHLNLPTQISINGMGQTGTITYIYDATGVKMRKTVSTGATTDYAGNYIYENGTLKFFSHPEGYVEPDGTNFDYVYQYKDHLGNIRLNYKDISTTSTPILEIIEENNYYPFGLKHKGYNNVINGTDHPYGFGGKEEQNELSINWIDITARNYDPALGRWMNIDPLAEQMRRHSPYNYAFNNPIFFIDPDGLSPCPTGNCVEGFDEIDSNSGSDVVTGDNVANELDEVVVVAEKKSSTETTSKSNQKVGYPYNVSLGMLKIAMHLANPKGGIMFSKTEGQATGNQNMIRQGGRETDVDWVEGDQIMNAAPNPSITRKPKGDGKTNATLRNTDNAKDVLTRTSNGIDHVNRSNNIADVEVVGTPLDSITFFKVTRTAVNENGSTQTKVDTVGSGFSGPVSTHKYKPFSEGFNENVRPRIIKIKLPKQ
ncbi:RHS repeat-associated core domain-containing protein, partial [Paucihalobacter ruber]